MNPAKQDSPPAAGRASDILPFRCSAIHASATIYPCAECASSQSVHSIVYEIFRFRTETSFPSISRSKSQPATSKPRILM